MRRRRPQPRVEGNSVRLTELARAMFDEPVAGFLVNLSIHGMPGVGATHGLGLELPQPLAAVKQRFGEILRSHRARHAQLGADLLERIAVASM